MSLADRVKPHIRSLAPYVPGKPIEELERELGIRGSIKLASNENPLGPSPRAVEAMRQAAAEIHRYPDGASFALRAALSKKLGVGGEQLVFGAGADEILELIAKTLLGAGDEVVFAWPSFAMYPIVVQGMGAQGRRGAARRANSSTTSTAMLAAITKRTRVVMVCNPNNPTGTSVGAEAFDRFVAALPEDVVLAVDEAYYEFVRRPDFPDCARADAAAAGDGRAADLLEDLRPRRDPHRLRRLRSRARELPRARTPSLQREPARGGRGPRGARGRRARAAHPRDQRDRRRAILATELAPARHRDLADRRQLHPGAHGRGRLRGAARAGRDRAADARLRVCRSTCASRSACRRRTSASSRRSPSCSQSGGRVDERSRLRQARRRRPRPARRLGRRGGPGARARAQGGRARRAAGAAAVGARGGARRRGGHAGERPWSGRTSSCSGRRWARWPESSRTSPSGLSRGLHRDRRRQREGERRRDPAGTPARRRRVRGLASDGGEPSARAGARARGSLRRRFLRRDAAGRTRIRRRSRGSRASGGHSARA